MAGSAATGSAATLGAAWLTGGASLLPGLSGGLNDSGSAVSGATSGVGAGAGAGAITFGSTKTNWVVVGAIAALGLVALVLAKKGG